MTQVVGVYVGKKGFQRRNLEIGLREGIWGLKGSAFEKGDTGAQMRAVATGDTLVVGHEGPGYGFGPWADPTFGVIVLARITRPHFVDETEVWPIEADGEVYEHRVRFDVVQRISGPVRLESPELVEALRMSQSKNGALVLAGPGAHDPLAVEPALVLGRSGPLPDAPDHLLDLSGVTDATSLATRRREQAGLRKACIGHGPTARCALCGRDLPVGFLRAAHIKKRADASEAERLDLANVMAACVLGCDELFERRIVVVDSQGVIQRHLTVGSPDLEPVVAALVGTNCAAHGAASAKYFAAHAADPA